MEIRVSEAILDLGYLLDRRKVWPDRFVSGRCSGLHLRSLKCIKLKIVVLLSYRCRRYLDGTYGIKEPILEIISAALSHIYPFFILLDSHFCFETTHSLFNEYFAFHFICFLLFSDEYFFLPASALCFSSIESILQAMLCISTLS